MTPAFRRRFGVHSLFIVLTVAVIGIVMAIKSFVSYRHMAHRDFGTPARIAILVEWFERIEKTPATNFVTVTDDPETFSFPETRMIPATAIPKEFFGNLWGASGRSSVPTSAEWGSVLAHYDEQHQLRAIEFYGSRYGALVSRDPALRPKMGGELEQLAGAPVFITARITGEPD